MSHHFFIANGSPIAMTTRYRCLHLSEQLRLLGHTTEVVDWSDETKIDPKPSAGADVIFLYRLLMSPALERLIAEAQKLGKRVIFDTDDLIFEPELISAHRAVQNLKPEDQKLHAEGVRRYLLTLQACDAVTTSTPVLAELARKRGKNAFVHRNSLGSEMLELATQLCAERPTKPASERVIMGYGSGTHTHDVDFLEAAEALGTVLQKYSLAELWIAGPLILPKSLQAFPKRVRRFPLADWPQWLHLQSQMDLAIAPLERGNIFCRAKSEVKFIEAGAVAVPLVGSDIDPYRAAISPDNDGLLAKDTDDWISKLSYLLEEEAKRREMGARARETVLARYSAAARAADLAQTLRELGIE